MDEDVEFVIVFVFVVFGLCVKFEGIFIDQFDQVIGCLIFKCEFGCVFWFVDFGSVDIGNLDFCVFNLECVFVYDVGEVIIIEIFLVCCFWIDD